jgi:aminoglycoside phosphotransferase (APT) family kinase protein
MVDLAMTNLLHAKRKSPGFIDFEHLHFHPPTEEFTDVTHANHVRKIREINTQTKNEG